MTSVFETQYINVKNRCLPGFNPQEPATFGFSVDANNLYGDVMQKEILPIDNFQFANEVSISEILNKPTHSTVGYFVEVEFEYPASIRDQHKDSPPAPVKEIVLDAWLIEFQNDMKERFNITQAKLFPNCCRHCMTRSIRFRTSSYNSYTINLVCAILSCTACYNSVKNNGWNPSSH